MVHDLKNDVILKNFEYFLDEETSENNLVNSLEKIKKLSVQFNDIEDDELDIENHFDNIFQVLNDFINTTELNKENLDLLKISLRELLNKRQNIVKRIYKKYS